MSQSPKSTEKILLEISEKLDKILGVLAIQNVSDVDSKIKILKNLGFSSAEIGPFMGLKNVRVHKGWKGK